MSLKMNMPLMESERDIIIGVVSTVYELQVKINEILKYLKVEHTPGETFEDLCDVKSDEHIKIALQFSNDINAEEIVYSC